MSQHDMNIDNGPGLAVRTDINAAIQALASTNAGPTEPATPYAGQFWLDTTTAPNGTVRVRNLANSAWIKLFDVVDSVPTDALRSTPADMSALFRSTPTPAFVINDKADGTGTDLFAFRDDGTVLLPASFVRRTTVLSSSSTFQFQAATLWAEVVVQAGGGGGGGTSGSSSAGTSRAGAGGGSGGYAKKAFLITPAIRAATKTIVVGAGGNGGGSVGSVGGNSSYTDGTNSPTANGGSGGAGGTAGSSINFCTGGSGGSGSGGDIVVVGSPGAAGHAFGTTIVQVAGNSAAQAGNGGSSLLGGGGLGVGSSVTSSAASGAGGTAQSGGGGGGGYMVNAAGTTATGGSGGDGRVIITEYR